MSKVLIICGTNRPDALSRSVCEIYQGILASINASSEIIDLGELPSDFIFSALYENAGSNPKFNEFNNKIKHHNKLVFIVPEYNGSFPGVLKAFIDGLEYPGAFKNKFCALTGLSSGVQGAGLALSHLTDIFNYCGMHVVAQKPKLANIEEYYKNGEIKNKLYMDLLKEQAEMLLSI